MKLTFFDVEYANSNNKSICQIGLVCCDSNDKTEILPSLDIYINPEDGFDERCVRVHGNYGTKVRKAMEYNKSDSHIKIMKEADFFPRLIGG